MNIAVGARQGVIDDLFVGNFLGKDCASLCPMIAVFVPSLSFGFGFRLFLLIRCYLLDWFSQRISSLITGRRQRGRSSTSRAITT